MLSILQSIFSVTTVYTADAFAQSRWNDGPWGPGGMMGWGGMGWAGGFIMIVFWIAVVIGIVYLIRYLTRRPAADHPAGAWTPPAGWDRQGPSQPESSALRILEERYARGEIDRNEFLERKADLTA